MKNQKIQNQYKEEFCDKYTTSVDVNDILKELNLEETIDERKEFKEFYKRGIRRVVKRLSLVFSLALVLFVSLTVVIMDKKDIKHSEVNVDNILSKEEKQKLSESGVYGDEKYNLISINNELQFFFMSSFIRIDNDYSYKYFYKVVGQSDEFELVLRIEDQEFIINQDNSFGEFYNVLKKNNEIITLNFSIEYDNQVKNYSFDE